MNLTDPVADFLTRIRNSIRARHQKLDVPASKLKGMNVTIVTTAADDNGARALLKGFGMPFRVGA